MNLPKIKIVPVVSSPKHNSSQSRTEAIAPVKPSVFATDTLETTFAEFLSLDVASGAASPDTVKSYLSQVKTYFEWCVSNIVPPLEADAEDLKFYRQYLVAQEYTTKTIANKLTIVNRLYQAAVNKGLITTNPAAGIKAPHHNEDPASRINFLEPEQLQTLLGYIDSQLTKATSNRQKLPNLRDRVLIGIMSLQGCRTVEMHQLQGKDLVRQGDRYSGLNH